MSKEKLSPKQIEELLDTLRERFENNMVRHKGIKWADVQAALDKQAAKLWSLSEMERTGGEPDVVNYDKKAGEYIFFDCAAESPKGRVNACYDRKAQDRRKNYPPKNNVMDMAAGMGIEILNEEDYRALQKLGTFDAKTSSWIKTPDDIRELGGAIFAQFRYGHVFVFANGADSYYAARGFRGSLKV